MIRQALELLAALLLGIVLVESIDALGFRLRRTAAPAQDDTGDLQLGHPGLILGLAMLTLMFITAGASFIPLSQTYDGGYSNVGLFMFAMLLDFGIISVAAIGWSSNTSEGVAASFGAIAQFAAFAIVIGFGMIGPAMVAQSLAPAAIIESQHALWQVVFQPISFLLYFAGSLAQSLRHPFSEPLAGPDGKGGILIHLRAPSRILIRLSLDLLAFSVAAMGSALFLAGWNGVPPQWGVPVYFLKIAMWLAAVAIVRRRVGEIGYEKMLLFFWKICMPLALVNIVLVGVMILVIKP